MLLLNNTYPNIDISLLNNNKPLLVCDADEVIFDFMTSFESFLNNQNLFFSWNSYALEGNILDKNKKEIHKDFIKEIINDFFKVNTITMNLMNGAKKSIKKLSSRFNIIVLSNIPYDFYNDRLKALKKNNLNKNYIFRWSYSKQKPIPAEKINTIQKIDNYFKLINVFIGVF